MKKRVRKPDNILRPKEFEALMSSGTVEKTFVSLAEDGYCIMTQVGGRMYKLGMSRGALPRRFKRLKTVEKWLAARGCDRCEKDSAEWPAAKADKKVKGMKADYEKFMAAPGNEDLKECMRDAAAGVNMQVFDLDEMDRQGEIARTATNDLLREVQKEAKRRVRAKQKAA